MQAACTPGHQQGQRLGKDLLAQNRAHRSDSSATLMMLATAPLRCWHTGVITASHHQARPCAAVPSFRHHTSRYHTAQRCPASSSGNTDFDLEDLDTADEAIEAGRKLCASQKYESAVECFEKVEVLQVCRVNLPLFVCLTYADPSWCCPGSKPGRSRNETLQVCLSTKAHHCDGRCCFDGLIQK